MLHKPTLPAQGVLAVLRHPGYRKFLIGTIIASSGLWICELALLYLIQTQTHSSTAVGVFLAVVTVPFVAGAFWGGLLTDRIGPRPLMAAAAIAWAAAIGVGALLALGHDLTLVPILVIGFVLGAFDSAWTVPIQVMAPAAVGRELTAAAVAAFPLQYGFGRLLGGIGGGALIAFSGIPLALAFSCAALVVAAVLLLTVPYDQRPVALPQAHSEKQLNAIRWVVASPTALTILIVAGLASLFTFSYIALLPAIAVNTLGAGATGLGVLTAAGGIGILMTSVFTDRLGTTFGRGRVILGVVAAAGLTLVVLALSANVLLSALACAGAGGLVMVFLSTSSLVLQAWSPPDIKGRAVSIYSLVFWGALPVGAVLVGGASDWFGPRTVLLACAVLSVGCAASVALLRRDFASVDVSNAGEPARLARH